MQRVSSARVYLRPAAPGAIRSNSTQSPTEAQPKLARKKWDDIIIPSREELLAKKKAAQELKKQQEESKTASLTKSRTSKIASLSESGTSIEYLKFESNLSLSARLARSTLSMQEKIMREKAEKEALAAAKPAAAKPAVAEPAVAEPAVAEPAAAAATPVPVPIPVPTSTLTPAEKRMAVRLAREAEKQAERQKKRAKVELDAASHTQRQIAAFNMINESLKPGVATRAKRSSMNSEIMEKAKASAAKRKEARAARKAGALESEDADGQVQTSRRERGTRQQKAPRKRGPNTRRRQENGERDESEDLVLQEGALSVEDAIAHLPEFTGARPASLDLTRIFHPKLVSDYSRYVPESLSFTTKRRDHLYAPTQLVQMVLSHRVDVSIPKRANALAIVTEATKASKLSSDTV